MFEQLVAFKAQSGGSTTMANSWGPPEEGGTRSRSGGWRAK